MKQHLSVILSVLKKKCYFLLARYFLLFASIKLWRWRPHIIVVTGSNGKTSLLHLLATQLQDIAQISFRANSSYGLPFDILGLHRVSLSIWEWPKLILQAPLSLFLPVPPHRWYLAEADADRPYEGKFLASFLKPSIVIWLSSTKTHSMNFDAAVRAGKFPSVEAAIAHEYGYFLEYCSQLAIVSADSPEIQSQLSRTQAQIIQLSRAQVSDPTYVFDFPTPSSTFRLLSDSRQSSISIPSIVPPVVGISALAAKTLIEYLDRPFDPHFSGFENPPGRLSVFKGQNDTILFDSTYNANLESMTAVLEFFTQVEADTKWLVLGDMIEQGNSEKLLHTQLAELIARVACQRVILYGPRVSKYTEPRLREIYQHISESPPVIETVTQPQEALALLQTYLKGGETILFKGSRFLEGVIEQLLENPGDADKLCRRESVWQKRRDTWGLYARSRV